MNDPPTCWWNDPRHVHQQPEAIREELERTSRAIARAWASAVESLLRDAVEDGVSLSTHTLVTIHTDQGGMMAWVAPNDAVSGKPRFPRIVLERNELRVTIRRETASPRRRSTSAQTSGDAKRPGTP